jgi:hypothetical protein
MNDAAAAKLPGRFSALVLATVTAWLLLLRPGQLAPDHPYVSLRLFAALIATYVLYLVAWKNHGALYGVVGIIIFLMSDRPRPEYPEEIVWQLNQILFLALLGFQLIAWSELNNQTTKRTLWLKVIICTWMTVGLIWVEAHETGRFLAAHPSAGWTVADQRMRNCSFILAAGGALLAFWYSRKNAASWVWLLACLAAPAAGFGLARLYVPVEPDDVLRGAQWPRVPADWQHWLKRPDLFEVVTSWAWATAWLVLPLLALGLWRALGRGFRQRRQGAMPLAWLLLLAALLLAAALVPVSSETLRPFGLLWLAVALPVFAVADLALLLYEQLALPAPLAGPSDVPRV